MPLPLHIFEQRYRDLLADLADAPDRRRRSASSPCARAPRPNPSAPTAPPGRRADRHAGRDPRDRTTPDGSSDLLAVGSRRFRVTTLVPDGKTYLRAEVELPRRDRRRPDPGAGGPGPRALLDVYDSILLRLSGRGTGLGPAHRRAAAVLRDLLAGAAARRGAAGAARRPPAADRLAGCPGCCGARSPCCSAPAASRCPPPSCGWVTGATEPGGGGAYPGPGARRRGPGPGARGRRARRRRRAGRAPAPTPRAAARAGRGRARSAAAGR